LVFLGRRCEASPNLGRIDYGMICRELPCAFVVWRRSGGRGKFARFNH
jgi:hypothetical protein